MRRKKRILLLLLALCLLLTGCGSAQPRESVVLERKIVPSDEPRQEDQTPITAPPIAVSAFHPEEAEGDAQTRIDLSAVEEGYVAVSVLSDRRLKFQVLKDEFTYNYDLSPDGTPSIFPLQCGDGHYVFRVMENIVDSKYAPIFTTERDVVLLDEFQPFLRPSDFVNYRESSACVLKAAELASACSSKLDVVSAVYTYVCDHIQYDHEKAASVQSGYLPDVDETMLSGKGICFDYAALAASMLRSQGIPTKIIFGYVAPNDVYHAWNMFYTEESGWVTVSFEASEKSWNRMDLTFSAGGASSEFVGDGSNYTDVYSY